MITLTITAQNYSITCESGEHVDDRRLARRWYPGRMVRPTADIADHLLLMPNTRANHQFRCIYCNFSLSEQQDEENFDLSLSCRAHSGLREAFIARPYVRFLLTILWNRIRTTKCLDLCRPPGRIIWRTCGEKEKETCGNRSDPPSY